MVQLKYFVKGFFSDFRYALAVTPLIESFTLQIALLNFFRVCKDD